jgi:hypothetical protein
MNIEQQCINLQIAKRLKELGVKQESYFFWVKLKDNGYDISERWNVPDYNLEQDYSAYTVAELGIMLPDRVEKNGESYCFIEWKLGGKYLMNYYGEFMLKTTHLKEDTHCYASIEANARGKMLIYLLENGMIKNG